MDSFIVVFNALLYLILLIVYKKKSRGIDSGFVLLSSYSTVAVMCVWNYFREPALWDLSLFPFIYLFIVLLLFFRPFISDNACFADKLKVPRLDLLYLFSVLFILFTIIVLYYASPQIMLNLVVGEWRELRGDMAAGEVSLYNNQFERFANIFTQYLTSFAVVVAFYFLKLRTKWAGRIAYMLIICVFSLSLSSAIKIASRGLIAFSIISLVLGYSIFKKSYTDKIQRRIRIVAFIIIGLSTIYLASVTISRFESNVSSDFDDTNSSLIYYFGHSMLVFDNGLMDSIDNYLYGKYMFATDSDIFLKGYDSYLHTHMSTSFQTFVGNLYMDFGPLITLFIAVLFPSFLLKLKRKKTIDIADLYIYFYYLDFITRGVFVVARGYYLGLLMSFVVYLCLKMSFKYNKSHVR